MPIQSNAIDLFKLAYGTAPGTDEITKLNALPPTSDDIVMLRRIISLFDRHHYPTRLAIRFDGKEVETRDLGDFSIWLDTADYAVSAEVFAFGHYEPHMTTFFKEHIKPGSTVIDIGANIGIFSIMAASLAGPKGKVLAFEPNTENCRLLLMSTRQNGFEDRVKLYPLGLSDKTGAAYFTTAVGSNGGMLPNDFDTLKNPNCVVIPTMRLDDMVSHNVDFIKADVEGAEYLALKGGEKLIRKHKPIITVEFSQEMIGRVSGIDGFEFLEWLLSLGYTGTVLGRSGERETIGDMAAFKKSWTNFFRIEDIAFLPNS